MFTKDEVIFAYTRKQAIADGVLIDVTEVAKEAGFKWPVAVTSGVWAEHVRVPDGLIWQDEQGRLWDILTMLMHAVRRAPRPGTALAFQVLVQNGPGKPSLVTFRAASGPDDEGKPCLTVMLPDED